MQVVNVRQLKSNPSEALRAARRAPVVVLNRDRPDAVLIGIDQLAGIPDFELVSWFAVALRFRTAGRTDRRRLWRPAACRAYQA